MKTCPRCRHRNTQSATVCHACGHTLAGVGDGSSGRRKSDTILGSDLLPSSGDDTLVFGESPPSEPAKVGMVLAGRYLMERSLGSGGAGEVYLARDSELQLKVAIKVLPRETYERRSFIQHLRNEAAIALRLTHPNICRLYSFESDGMTGFLVMEFVEGRTLRHLLDSKGDRRLELQELLPIAEDIAAALDHAHTTSYVDDSDHTVSGVLHRDIKPANIMVTAQGRAKLMDFGIAREIHQGVAEVTGRRSQAPHYASPEQFSGDPMGPASDIYSFTSVLFECLSGRPLVSPDGDLHYQILHKPCEAIPALPPQVNQALASGLAKDPRLRPQTAGTLVRMLSEEGAPAAPARPSSTAELTAAPRLTVKGRPSSAEEPSSVAAVVSTLDKLQYAELKDVLGELRRLEETGE